jgi:hypothetical protein
MNQGHIASTDFLTLCRKKQDEPPNYGYLLHFHHDGFLLLLQYYGRSNILKNLFLYGYKQVILFSAGENQKLPAV